MIGAASNFTAALIVEPSAANVTVLRMARAAAFIGEELRQTGAAVSRQPFETAGVRYENVVAAFGPDTPNIVVVGAHYDVAGEMPGADDNAGGLINRA